MLALRISAQVGFPAQDVPPLSIAGNISYVCDPVCVCEPSCSPTGFIPKTMGYLAERNNFRVNHVPLEFQAPETLGEPLRITNSSIDQQIMAGAVDVIGLPMSLLRVPGGQPLDPRFATVVPFFTMQYAALIRRKQENTKLWRWLEPFSPDLWCMIRNAW